MPSVVKQKDQGKAVWFLGELYDIRVTGAETGGKFCVVEVTVPPGLPMAAPPHVHLDADETVRVLEGTGRYHVDNQIIDAPAGAILHFPKGTLEWFENVQNTPLKVQITYSPGGFEQFFLEVGEPAASRTLPPAPTSPPDLNALQPIARKYGLELRAA